MGSLLDSPTMGCLGYLSLVALLACGIQGASLPYQNGYKLHLNQKGVRMDLAMKDVNPLVGGKVHIELPISSVWKMLEVDAQLLKPIIKTLEKTTLPVWKLLEVEAPFLKPILIALEKNTVGRIYDVMTVKADITFNAEELLKGIFNVAVDYTLVHKDGTEEKATLLIQDKNQSGQSVTSVEIIPKNNVVMSEKKIFFPLEMIITCNWPSAHTLSIKGDFGKMFINIANDMNEVSVRGVLEYLGQQYKYSTILSIREKYFTVTFQEPSKDLYDIVIKFNMINGFPRIEITGNIPTFQYFKAGDFKTEVIVNSWLNYKIKHTFHGMEVLSLKFEMLDGFPRIEITGNVPATRFFTAGVFKSELIVKSLYNYEIKYVFKGMEILNLNIALINGKMEMIMKYGQTHKTHIVLEYEYLRWIKILLPSTNTWLSKDLGVEMHYQPTNEEKLIEGGNIKVVAKSNNMPVMKFGGYYGLTLDSQKFEILLNDFYINLLNNEIMLFDGIPFSELKFYGKIALHHLNMNVMSCHAMSCHLNLKTMIPKIAMEAKIHKDEQKVFHYLLTTMETPCKVHIFFPYVFQNILGLAQEHMEITHEHVVLGHKQVITTLCNLTTKKIITKVTPTMMSIELFDGEVSLIKYVTELTKIDVGKNSLILEGNKIVQFNAYKPWFLPSELKFYGKIALQHLNMNVVDYLHLNTMIPKITLEAKIHKDEQKVFHYLLTTMETPMKLHIFFPYLFQNILSMSQEHVEISHEHVVLGNKQVITTLCNLTTKKIITKVTPTMMSLELFDGELSLVKYVTELTKVVVGRNSMLLEGNKIVQFTGYQPWFLPAILKFNQLKTKFHLEVVDKAERKININVAVFKDTTELLNAVVNNVEVPYMIVVKAPVLPLEMKVDYKQSAKVWDVKINNESYLKVRQSVPYMLVVKAPVLPLEMRIDYELSTKVWDVKINTKSYLKVRPTLAKEVEVVLTGVPLFRVALLAKELRI